MNSEDLFLRADDDSQIITGIYGHIVLPYALEKEDLERMGYSALNILDFM